MANFRSRIDEDHKLNLVRNAAPLLLAALEDLLDDAEFFSARLGNESDIDSIVKARVAIKKSKGEV